jgi:tetratricopeptide (TPR) repeat protein
MIESRANGLEGILEAAGQAVLRQDAKAAEDILRSAVLEGAMTLAATWANLGLVLSMDKREAEANVELGRALDVWDAAHAAGDPDPPDPVKVEGVVAMLVHAKRVDEAVAVVRAAAARGPADPRTTSALGAALSAAGDQTEAAKALARSSAEWLAAGAVDRAIIDASVASGMPGAGPAVALAAAWALAAKGDGGGARARYDEAVAADPTMRSPALEAELARVQGKAHDALVRADAVLASAPDDAEALAVRAQALRDLGRFPEAIASLDKLLDADASDRFRLLRALLRAAISDSRGALADLDAVGPLTANAPLAFVVRAEIYLYLERYDDALAWFDRFRSVDPGNAVVDGERALALLGQGRAAEAEKEIEALFADPPADPAVAQWMNRQEPARLERVRGELLVIRGRMRIAGGRYSEARADLTAADGVVGPRSDITAALAQATLAADKPAQALAIVEAASPVIGAIPDVLAVKAAALLQLERYDEALAAISKALEVNPGNARYRRLRALILPALGRLEDAVADLAELAKSLPDDPEIHHQWGVALRDLGRRGEALARLAAAEALGGEVAVFIDHASLLRDLDRPEEALEVLAVGAERFPEDASLFQLRGSILASQGNYQEAATALRRSIDLDPDQPTVAANLGEYLRRLGEYDEALVWLDRALAADQGSYYALGTKGQVLRATGDTAGGLALLREAVGLAGDEAPAWLLEELALALSSEGSQPALIEALERLDRYLASGRRDVWALAAKAETLRLLDRPGDGLEAADAALQAEREAGQPDDEGTLGTKAHLLLDLARPEEALVLADRLLASAAAKQWENVFALMARIRALLAMERHAEALPDVDRYLEVTKGDQWGLLTKASLLSDYREFRTAADILERVGPGDPFRDGLLGFCRNRLGDPRGAISALEAAVAANKRTWWYWAELGDAYLEVGESDKARRVFQVLLEEAASSSASDDDLLINAAWASHRLDDPTSAVGFAQRALGVSPTSPMIRLFLGTLLLVTGRGLAGVSEIEAAVARAAELPDSRRGAAVLEEAIDDLERLGREGALDHQRAEADEALDILRTTSERLRHPQQQSPPPATVAT